MNVTKFNVAAQRGFSLMEVMVSLAVVSVIALGLAVSNIAAMKVAKSTEIHHAVSSIAASKMEELAALDITQLDSGADETNVSVNWPALNIAFTRTTSVTVNADDSRTVAVTVASSSSEYPTSVTFHTNFAGWE